MGFDTRFNTLKASAGAAAGAVIITTLLTLLPGARIVGDMIPSADNAYDIGSSSLRWQDIYTSGRAVFDNASGTGNIVEATSSTLGTSYMAVSAQGSNFHPSLMVRGLSAPTSNLFEVENLNGSVKYLTVSSTSTIATVPYMAADGSAGGPAFSFSGDTNTGVYHINSDSMGFSAGGLRFQVDSTGAAIIAGSSASPSLKFTTDTNTGIFSAGADILGVSAGGQAVLTVSATSATFQGKLAVPSTITPGGTTGNQTINLPSGSVNVATAGTSVTVTNSTVLATSLVFAHAMTNDTTCYVKDTEVSAGSFVIRMTGACAAETKVGFIVFN